MRTQSSDPYEVLGLDPSASRSQITHAFRDQLWVHHPDAQPRHR